MTTMDQAKLAFHSEANELLDAMEQALLDIEKGNVGDDAINSIFRAAHTIKGTAGVFSFDPVEAFTHVVENVLDRIRSGRVSISEKLVAILLQCRDHIGQLVEIAVQDLPMSDDLKRIDGDLLERLKPFQNDEAAKSDKKAQVADASKSRVISGEWQIDVRFGETVLKDGMDPASFIRYLKKLGTIVNIATTYPRMPEAGAVDAENCFIDVLITLKSETASKEKIEKVFEFVQHDVQLSILPPVDAIWDYISAIKGLPEDVIALGEMLKQAGTLTQQELADALDKQQQMRNEASPGQTVPKLGEILVEENKLHPEVLSAALDKQDQAQQAKKQSAIRQLRVDADKLDSLINLVGELVISGATANLLAQRVNDNQLLEAISSMSRLVEEIRDSALRLRMVQIGETFSRFQRVVRDVSHELGKDIQLMIDGGETELDKTMVEKIGDPLMHLVRNAMDHGIESADERKAKGKEGQGTLYLNAYHDSGSIVIQVSDDGRGLDKDRILKKAVEKGLVQPGVSLSDQEIYRLIFEPGFSTAEKVTNLSGRGVGMDVVRRNIESLRGTVDIDTEKGEGTSIIIRLPLTLAIIDGFLVEVAKGTYVIPLDMVVECIELSDEDRESALTNKFINLRGSVLPLLRLSDMFGVKRGTDTRENIVVVQNGGNTAGLVVDALLGEFQTVIKPLGKIFENLQGISGSTILGTGDVAVILDVNGLIQRAMNDHSLASDALQFDRAKAAQHESRQTLH